MPHSKSGREKRPALTHFLCIPLVNEESRSQLKAALEVLQQNIATIIPRQAIRPVGTLHLTLGVMSLDRTRLEKAIEILRSIDLSQQDNQVKAQDELTGISTPLTIQLRGLQSMHDPEHTSVLYVAPFDPTDRLQSLCLTIQNIFQENGLLVADDRPLKLHATVVNTIYAKGLIFGKTVVKNEELGDAGEKRPSGHTQARSSTKFDARDVLQQHEKFILAQDVVLDRLAICEMGAKKEYDEGGRIINEEYNEVAYISLPLLLK